MIFQPYDKRRILGRFECKVNNKYRERNEAERLL